MAERMKIRADLRAGTVEAKVLMYHPMENGLRKDPDGKPIPAHFIQKVTASLNGKVVLAASWGSGVSKDPYLAFRFKGAKAGDRLVVAWEDNLGGKGEGERVIT
ncbi:MAG: thiosulfate oxidation carrier complex protein SoxZ [Rhodocyclaceae bacterium]